MSDKSPESIPASEQPPMSDRAARRMRRRYAYYDPVNRVVWAALLVMTGAILLAGQLGLLPSYHNASAWDWIMLGAGGVLVLAELVRALSGDYGKPTGWMLIAGVVLMGIGAGAVFGISASLLWPAGLIAIGVVLLVRNIGSH